jgi:trans-aconitate methyltransferase
MRDIVVAQVPGGRPIRVLDIGCGTGSLVFGLVEALPQAAVTGIDISAANILAAESRRAQIADAARMHFEQVDYLQYRTAPVDAIVSDGVLHLIGGETRAVFAKLAQDLLPGGTLIVSMPYDCVYNRLFAMLRRTLRTFRSRRLDAAILRIGRLLHGHEMSDEGLRERVHYMYLPPTRVADRALREQVAPSVGLRAVARHPMASVSPSQLKHEVIVFERTAA